MTVAVAVTGVGIVSPIGCGREQFWSGLVGGRSGIAPLERVKPTKPLPTVGAEVRDFAAREFITSANLRRMGNVSRLVVAASRMALDDARLTPSSVPPERLGVVVGTALGDIHDSIVYLEKVFARGPAAASPLLFPNLVLNAPASYVAMEFGATGVNLTVAQAEISGETAIVQGCDAIRSGRADVVLAGGGDEIASIVLDTTFRARGLSGQRGGPEWCSPYDRERNGLVLGEGAAMLVLEPLERARGRGAAVLAIVESDVAYAVDAPLYDWPATAPEAVPSLRRLGGGVDVIFGAANSTWRLDTCELRLFDEAFASADSSPWVTSIKGAVGEFGGAGAMTVAAACLALRAQVVPPLCALRTAETVARLRFTRESTPAELERVVVSGLARGGAGAALALRRA